MLLFVGIILTLIAPSFIQGKTVGYYKIGGEGKF